MPSAPALSARMSVSVRCLPFGRTHPSTRGVSGNIRRAVAVTLAMSAGVGGLTFAMAVPRMGMNAITTTAEGSAEAMVLSAASSPFSFPS